MQSRASNPPHATRLQRPPPPQNRIRPDLFTVPTLAPAVGAKESHFIVATALLGGAFAVIVLSFVLLSLSRVAEDARSYPVAEANIQSPVAPPADPPATMSREARDGSGADEPEALRLVETREPRRRWSAGSTKAEVESIEGPALAIERNKLEGEERWRYYNLDSVTFDSRTGTVVEWRNYSGSLRIGIAAPNSLPLNGMAQSHTTADNSQSVGIIASVVDMPDSGTLGEAGAGTAREPRLKRYWTLGSTKAVVEEIDGAPTTIRQHPALGYEEWSYHCYDKIKFGIPSGRVTEWDNASGRLSVALTIDGQIAIPEPGALFGQGCSMDDVLRAQGTPRSVAVHSTLGYVQWGYNSYDTIKFDVLTARVLEWENDSGSLRLRAQSEAGQGALR